MFSLNIFLLITILQPIIHFADCLVVTVTVSSVFYYKLDYNDKYRLRFFDYMPKGTI